MSSIESSSISTVHYAKPVVHAKLGASSSSPRSSSNPSTPNSVRSPNIRYPTVVVKETGNTSPSYAVPVPKKFQYSTSHLQYEHIRHRCKMLDEENQKLMKMQSDVVNDANRRVQMHVNEIRMLKDENKKMQLSNKELRDLCCFLDDDRQKTRRLAREWQKFGRYTSNLMKQEIQSYHQKLSNLEEKLTSKEREVDELRQLCMYLDEQRQCLMGSVNPNNHSIRSDDESEDLGCGSSEQSGGSNDDKEYCFNQHKESTLRRITEQMATSMDSTICDEERREASKRERSRLLGYIQSLENRIKHLEMSQNHESFWNSSSNMGSDCDEKTIIERSWDVENTEPKNNGATTEKSMNMMMSMTSSGCTTYASSGTDADSVFVMGDEIDIGNLEVRTLSRIDEEAEKMAQSTIEESARMPPKIAPPVCSSLLSVANFDEPPTSIALMRSASESCHTSQTTVLNVKGGPRCISIEKSNPITCENTNE
ncbi:unnamed protein product [Caenorhabditis bovis]|uniref:Uncharacterized protein n=1 Tax=Caenorhabditis bovis TaxID=2654633 RepID=A0A8S1EAF0_9PELO|nr:unnamed protein product [Caenorhabditis bovis]